MAKPKPVQARLSDLTPGQLGDFFALLAEKNKGATREGKPYYACRFRDARRTVAFMVWGDGPWFAACESDWQAGHFYKLRAVYGEHDRYGPQITELVAIRPAADADLADGFDPAQLVESSRYDPETMFTELKALATRRSPTSRCASWSSCCSTNTPRRSSACRPRATASIRSPAACWNTRWP